jgi:hypothetical protein
MIRCLYLSANDEGPNNKTRRTNARMYSCTQIYTPIPYGKKTNLGNIIIGGFTCSKNWAMVNLESGRTVVMNKVHLNC